MNVSLTPELEKMIQKKVKSGMYTTASELIRDALRIWQDREIVREARLKELREAIQVAEKQFERGEYIELNTDDDFKAFVDDINARGHERLKKLKKQRKESA